MGAADEHGDGDATPRTYTLPQLAEISGIDYRTLHNWQKRGLLSPSHQLANGSGTTSLFVLEDALQILVLAELRQAGVEMRVLEAIADDLRGLVGQLGDERVLVVIGEKVQVLDDARELDASLRSSGPLVVYRPARARRALRALDAA
jgi:DNA-binding transcriptional MerR regulator